MVLPITVRNNFVKREGKPYVDIVSKVFVYCELLLGVNCFPIISVKQILVALSYVYSLSLNAYLCYETFNGSFENMNIVLISTSRLFQYEFSAILRLFTWKRFDRFYREIEKFDNEVGCRPKFTNRSKKLLLSFVILFVVFFCNLSHYQIHSIPLHLISTFEYVYFGHFIDLIITRMRLLNYYLEYSTSIAKTDSSPKIDEFVFFDNDSRRFYFPNMDEMIDLYQIIVNAHKFLVDAVKWQMFVTVVTSFIYNLVTSYLVLLPTMDAGNSLQLDFRIGVLLLSYMQLFPPCMRADNLQEEVCRFRELLASSLYENQSDRSSRSTTRTLLIMTETRNLSFLLLRVLNISVSLPFSFIGLIVTYLIILLQFKKVLES